MRIKPLLFGMATVIPGVYGALSKPTGGTSSARYCYSVWLRHLVAARRHGLEELPSVVVEMGPGDSLGIGLAALISGADRYYALDVVQRARAATSLEIFDRLVELFERRELIPGEQEFPHVRPRLPSYAFPRNVLDGDRLSRAMAPDRLYRLREEIAHLPQSGSAIAYVTPADTDPIPAGSVDVVLSQGVLEYPDDLCLTYAQMARWLRPGGMASHAIDFGAHQTSDRWDGHWAISDIGWACLRGRQPYYLNRAPHSAHIDAVKAAGLAVVCDTVDAQASATPRASLAPRFQALSDADRTARAGFIQARKPSF